MPRDLLPLFPTALLLLVTTLVTLFAKVGCRGCGSKVGPLLLLRAYDLQLIQLLLGEEDALNRHRRMWPAAVADGCCDT